MATADKLDYLLETKNQIKEAIKGKGVNIEDTDSFRSYASKIGQIEGESSTDDFWNIRTKGGSDLSSLFYNCSNFTEINLSGRDTSNATNMSNMFYQCRNLTEINLSGWDTSNATNMYNMFYGCSKLIRILGFLDCIKVTSVQSMFGSSYGPLPLLEEVRIKNLNSSPLDLSYCTSLSYDSLLYLINNLVEITRTYSIILGSTNLAKLTDEEKAIATNKGWTLS